MYLSLRTILGFQTQFFFLFFGLTHISSDPQFPLPLLSFLFTDATVKILHRLKPHVRSQSSSREYGTAQQEPKKQLYECYSSSPIRDCFFVCLLDLLYSSHAPRSQRAEDR